MNERIAFVIDGEPKVEGEYFGNESSGRVVIFSHGFGVKRGSRTLFKDLAERLKEKSLVCLFDYVGIDAFGNLTVLPFRIQAKKLKKVLTFVESKFKLRQRVIVAHSQGCLIVGQLSPVNIDKTILVAPPISPPAKRVQEYFSQRPETEINLAGTSRIKRSDGTFTFVPADYWPEAEKIDGSKLYARLAGQTQLYFIRALDDQVVVNEDYLPIKNDPKVNYLELSGNHDFENETRQPWLKKMVEIIES